MARQILPIVGGVVGAYFGGPQGAQIGYAIGSIIGNAVDPIEVQGRKLGDAPAQTTAEGGARAIVYGTGCIRATVVMERGGRRVIKDRQKSGKGGGPVTINERALWTYAIGLGEAIPGGAILRIWEAEKLVYDVTPDSQIVADSAKYASSFRFYDGSEDQLPDPALEAIHGVGEAPYYRGTAYMVFPQYDLTDFGEAVPVYRVEVAALPEPSASSSMVSTSGGIVAVSPTGIDFSTTRDSSSGYLIAGPDRYVMFAGDNVTYTLDSGVTWSYAGSIGASGGPRKGAWFKGSYLIPAYVFGVYVLSADCSSIVNQPYPATPAITSIAASDSIAVGMPFGGTYLYYTETPGGSWVQGVESDLAAGTGESCAYGAGVFKFGGSYGGAPRLITTGNGTSKSLDALPAFASATAVTAVCYGNGVWLIGTDSGECARNSGAGWSIIADSMPGFVSDIAHNGERFIVAARTTVGGTETGFIASSEDGSALVPRRTINSAITISAACFNSAVVAGDKERLSSIIAALHDRSGHTPSDYSVVELSELVDGVVIESTVTAAEAINSIIGCHFADPSDYDGKIHYIKRGKAVVRTLTADDLIDEPESEQRNNAIEYPRKAHFLAQRADLAYGSSKSTSSRYSPDAKVVGEVSYTSPETFSEPVEPAKIAVKLHKILWTEAEGERVWHVTDEHLDLVPTDAVGLSYRGELVRCRITQIEDDPGQRKLKMIRDRQSAYTATLTEIPNPVPPTPPQSSIVAPTVLAVMDLPALTDNADTLNYYVGMSGQNDQWIGAVLQQSLDSGASFGNIGNTTINAIMGTTLATVSDASPYYTDGTNKVEVTLYMDDELESVTPTAFLSNGGAFALSWQDSGETQWELMQYRDAEHVSGNTWRLSHLLRGRKNTEAAEHPPGAMFVLIDQAIMRHAAQSAWLGTDLTHRAVSNGLSPETATPQTGEYVGHSQREWPVASLTLSRPDASTVSASVVPRHRFGTSMNPIRSVNWTGYRWEVTDGTNTITRDGTAAAETFDTTGWASPVSVTVAQLNRLTGAGDAVTEDIA